MALNACYVLSCLENDFGWVLGVTAMMQACMGGGEETK